MAIAAAVASQLVHAPTATWDTAWTAAAVSAVAATLGARHRAVGIHRFRWTMWTAGCLCWLVGQILWDTWGADTPPSPNLNDVADWGFALFVIAGVVRSPLRSRSLRRVAVVETLPLIAAALALTMAELWHSVATSSAPVPVEVSALVYPGLYVSAAVVTLQALVGGWLRGVSSIPSRLVLGGIVAQAVAFVFWTPLLLAQTYVQGSSMLDPLWVIGMLAIAAGGLLGARSPDPVAAIDTGATRGGVLPGVMFALLVAALIQAVVTRDEAVPEIALACGLLFCGGTLMLRGHLLWRRLQRLLDQERGAVADLAERELELARLNQRLVEDSRHDALTGMRNRRALAYDLPRVESQHRARGDWFAIAVCDVDHFKPYNDRLGHLAGDQALRTVSGIIRDALREEDIGYRFGGEELLVILPSTRAAEAVRAAERIRRAVADAALPHPDGIDGILTVSVGVAAGREDAAALLARADAALYEAKRAGRNRVVAASDGSGLVPARDRREGDGESVPRQLRSMLTVSRAAASGMGAMPVLQALAEMIRLELSFEVVAVNLRNFERDELKVVVVLGDEEARRTLLGMTNPWSEFARLIQPEHERCGAMWLPAGSDLGRLQTWEPAVPTPTGSEGWQAEDMLLLPIRDAAGEVLGVVSVDRPASGRRPDDHELSVLMAVADHAGLALERAQREHAEAEAAQEQSTELRLAAVMLLAETLDLRDPGTGRHSRTVGVFARHIAVALGLSPVEVERVHAAGVLHDLGKLGIADAILYKPGPLTDQEWREMKRHPEVGARILEHAGLIDLASWVRSHHERIDGRGYPDALSGEEIPLESRILAVADAYEAMVADRPYRAGISAEDARAELVRCAGTQFDAAVVEAFLGTLSDNLELELEELSAAA